MLAHQQNDEDKADRQPDLVSHEFGVQYVRLTSVDDNHHNDDLNYFCNSADRKRDGAKRYHGNKCPRNRNQSDKK
jgi:hypothetical protein